MITAMAEPASVPPLDTDAYETYMDEAMGCIFRQPPGARGWTNMVLAALWQIEFAEKNWNFN